MKKIVVLNGPNNLSPFITKVIDGIKADGIMWMDQYDPGIEYKKNVENLKYGASFDSKTIFYIFDVFLVPTLLILKKYSGISKVYVQHGAFSDILIENRRKKLTLSWFLRSIKNGWRFLILFGFNLKTITLLFKILKYGPWHARDKIKELKLCINYGIFWSKIELNEIIESEIISFHAVSLCKSPDVNALKLKYNPNGKVVYIGQPLVEDTIVEITTYRNFIQNLISKYCEDIVFIIHPRQQLLNEKSIKLHEIINHIPCRKVVGHFSSLLLAVPKNIPIEYECFKDDCILEYSRNILNARNQTDDNIAEFEEAIIFPILHHDINLN